MIYSHIPLLACSIYYRDRISHPGTWSSLQTRTISNDALSTAFASTYGRKYPLTCPSVPYKTCSSFLQTCPRLNTRQKRRSIGRGHGLHRGFCKCGPFHNNAHTFRNPHSLCNGRTGLGGRPSRKECKVQLRPKYLRTVPCSEEHWPSGRRKDDAGLGRRRSDQQRSILRKYRIRSCFRCTHRNLYDV